MKQISRIFAAAAVLMAAVLPVRADDLDDYARALDRVEAGFWRAMFSSSESSRAGYKKVVLSLNTIARKIHQAEFVAGIPHNTGDFINSSVRINSMLDRQLPSYRKANITMPTLKKSNLTVFRQKVAREQKRNSRRGLIPYEELDLEDYRAFLDEVRDENIRLIERRIRTNRGIGSGSKEDLIKIAESFYKYVSDLRYTVLKLRQQHKLFRKQDKKTSR